MTTKKLPGGNILPHNPLKAARVLDEVKKLKGDTPWIQFELELLADRYPGNAVLKGALGDVTRKAKTRQLKVEHE